MRTWLWVMALASLPVMATAQSVHTVKLINDTRSSVVAFWVAPAGTHAWIKVDLSANPVDAQSATDVELRGDQACKYDFRTTLSDGRIILAPGFDVCRLHAYRAGRPFWHGHPGIGFLP